MCRKNVQPLGTKHIATSCKNQGQRTMYRSSLNLLSRPNAQAPAPNKKKRKVTSCGKTLYNFFYKLQNLEPPKEKSQVSQGRKEWARPSCSRVAVEDKSHRRCKHERKQN
jgi:hypothetical protein